MDRRWQSSQGCPAITPITPPDAQEGPSDVVEPEPSPAQGDEPQEQESQGDASEATPAPAEAWEIATCQHCKRELAVCEFTSVNDSAKGLIGTCNECGNAS